MSKKKCRDNRRFNQPPKEHQFQPGQSGNPKGRPRKETLTRQEMFAGISSEVVSVNIGGEKIDITVQEAVMRKTISDALAGDTQARKMFDKWAREFEEANESKASGGGVVVVPATMDLDEWVAQQEEANKYRKEPVDYFDDDDDG